MTSVDMSPVVQNVTTLLHFLAGGALAAFVARAAWSYLRARP